MSMPSTSQALTVVVAPHARTEEIFAVLADYSAVGLFAAVTWVAGLWAGLEQTPFNTLEILPGQTGRAVRAFYRRLDSSEVEERLRAQLFDPAGHLPLPRGGEVPVVYVEDVAAATQTMARGLWTKHRDVLRGPRLSPGDVGAQSISIWAALRMFVKFMGAALRRAPGAWWAAVTGSVSS